MWLWYVWVLLLLFCCIVWSIILKVHSASWIFVFIFQRIGQILSHHFFPFSVLRSFSSPGTLVPQMLGLLIFSQSFLGLCSSPLSHSSVLCYSDEIIPIDLFSSLLIFFYHLHSIQWVFTFHYYIFLVNTSFGSCLYLLFFSGTFKSFHLFCYFLSIFIKAHLKSLSNNINICVLSVLVSLDVFYHISWDFPDYLIMSNFGLYPACFEYHVMGFWALFKSYGEFFFFQTISLV